MTAITDEQLNNPAIYNYILKLVGEDGIETLRRWSDVGINQDWINAKLADESIKEADRKKFLKYKEIDPVDFASMEKSDEDLADITQISLNTIRHTLYSLYEHRLAEYRRIKNSETGWLTYLWVMRMENINSVLMGELDTAKSKLEAKLHYDEANDFYQCKECGLTITFNEAMEQNFSCPQCDNMLVHFDNELLVNAVRKRIDDIQSALNNV